MQSNSQTDDFEIEEFSSGDLRQIAGLSYRQINEWDRRGVLPSFRPSERGWRRSNALQALALRIVADLHRSFGIPLKRLKKLLLWMLGEEPSMGQLSDLATAEAIILGAWGTSRMPGEEYAEVVTRRFEEMWPEDLRHPVDSNKRRSVRYQKILPEETRGDGAPGASSKRLVQEKPKVQDTPREELVATAVQSLLERGWDEETASKFASDFFRLSRAQGSAVSSLEDLNTLYLKSIHQLELGTDEGKHPPVMKAVEALRSSLIPLLRAMDHMKCGFLVLLTTDFDAHSIVPEELFEIQLQLGVLPPSRITLELNDHVNAVAEAAGMGPERFPVMARARDEVEDTEADLGAAVKRIFDLTSDGSVHSIRIESRNGSFRLIQEKDLPTEADISDALSKHDFQTVTIKQHDGKIERLTQTISTKVSEPKAPRKATERTRASKGTTTPTIRGKK